MNYGRLVGGEVPGRGQSRCKGPRMEWQPRASEELKEEVGKHAGLLKHVENPS